MDGLWRYLSSRDGWDLARDALDLLITYYIFYRVALVLRGTRATQVVFGLALLFVLYLIAQLLHLDTVLTLLGAVLSSAILIGVVVFQNDIRRGLMRVGARARFGTGPTLESKVIDNVVEAAKELARHRIGALITFEQEANLDEFVGSHTGQPIDATVSAELLVSLFLPDAMNKLHDGAVIIRELRIAKAGVFFPMPEGRVMDESFGSRHRAALGITEETDAVVVVVSEERGSIAFFFNGNIIPNLDGPKLKTALEGVFVPKGKRRPLGDGLLSRWFGKAPAATKPAGTATGVAKRASEARLEEPPISQRAPSQRPPAPLLELQGLKRTPTDAFDDSAKPAAPAPLRRKKRAVSTQGTLPGAQPGTPPGSPPGTQRPSTPPPAARVPSLDLRTPLRHMVPLEGRDPDAPADAVPRLPDGFLEPPEESNVPAPVSSRPMPRGPGGLPDGESPGGKEPS